MVKFILISLILLAAISTLSAFGDSGSSGFTNALTVSNIGNNSTAPQLIVSGNNVYVGWVGSSANNFDIFFAKSSDGGTSFDKPISLKNSNIAGADNVKITQSNGEIYVVWQSFSANKSAILFSKSSDDGSTFRSPMALSDMAKDSAFPQIAVSGNHVYTTWLERTEGDVTNVVFSKSDDKGNSFGAPVEITHHTGNSGLPQVVADANDVYLSWEDNSLGNFDVFVDKSTDAGTTFGMPANVSNDTGDSGTPQLNVIGQNLYLVWMDNTPGNLDILFSKSTDGGVTFGKPVNLSGNKEDSGYPQLVVYGNNIYVTWTNAISDKNYDVLFAKSSDGGQTFAYPINISNDTGASGWPQIAVDGNVYVSWVDNTPGNFDIYIAKSDDDGKSFESPVDISNTPHESWYNRMAVSTGTVYMVWQEVDNAGHDVIFTKSTTFVPEFGALVPIILVITTASIIVVSKRSAIGIHV